MRSASSPAPHGGAASDPVAQVLRWIPAPVKETLASVFQFVFVLQQPHKYSKQQRYRAWVIVGAVLLFFTAMLSLLYSLALAWLLGLAMQLAVVAVTSFSVYVLMEYQDKSSDGAEVERLTRPLIEVQLWTRVVQVVHTLLLGEWWLALFIMLPQVPLDLYLRSTRQFVPDPTSLWKTCHALDWWGKVKLLYQAVVVVVFLVLMIFALVSNLLRGGG